MITQLSKNYSVHTNPMVRREGRWLVGIKGSLGRELVVNFFSGCASNFFKISYLAQFWKFLSEFWYLISNYTYQQVINSSMGLNMAPFYGF